MSEYQDEPSDLTVLQIPSFLDGNEIGNKIGKVTRIRRVSDSKETLNGLVPVSRSNPRSLCLSTSSSGYVSSQVLWQIVSSDAPIEYTVHSVV